MSVINNDYIWLSLASEFDDIKDSTIKYNFRSQKDKMLDIYFDWGPFILKNELKKKNPLAKDNIEKEADKLFENFKKKMEEFKDYYYVTCFTQTFINDNLWGTYSKKYTGFCIEYDSSIIKKSEKKHLLFDFASMIYGDKKPFDFIDLFRRTKMEYCEENYDKSLVVDMDVQFNLQTRKKSKTYDHEKEWRFYQKKDDFKSRKLYFPYISKIY